MCRVILIPVVDGIIYQYLPVVVGLSTQSIFFGRPITLHRELSSIINDTRNMSPQVTRCVVTSYPICRAKLYNMSSQIIQYVVTNYTICRLNYAICHYKLYNISAQTIYVVSSQFIRYVVTN